MEFSNPASTLQLQYYNQPQPQSQSHPHPHPHPQPQPQPQSQQQEPKLSFNIGLIPPFFPRSYQSQPIYSTPPSPSLSTSSSSFTFQQPYTQPLNPYNVSNNINSLTEYSPNISEFSSSQPNSLQPLMPSGQSNGNYISSIQSTTPSRQYHQRESSLSTLGSPGAPASPFAPSTSNPLVVGDSYHEFQDYPHPYQKSLTPTHTPLQANIRWPGTPTYPQHQMASNDSPATPTSHEDERQQFAQGSSSRQMPKLTRTTTDAYDDELYLGYPNVSTPSPAHASARTSSAPANDIFAQRLQAANHQHLTSNKTKNPTRMRQEQKAKDAWAIQEQYERANSEQVTPKTISPKDVDFGVSRRGRCKHSIPFHPSHNMGSCQWLIVHNQPFLMSHRSRKICHCHNRVMVVLATTRRESSSAYSTSSQSTSRQNQMAFNNTSQTPTVSQHYSFVPSTQRQTSNMSNVSNMSDMSLDFPATMTSMESGNSEYSPEQEIQRPSKTSANSGTYTCTYHGCTLRFDTPTKLQQHKKEGHRNSTSLINNLGGENRGQMTSMAQKLNSQSGPHQCTQINPSTNKTLQHHLLSSVRSYPT
ncbi:hypothetical protein EYC84_009698 [Monilinia fructicola]|uniref:C2H2-type domain-containing protein n=1 Tax=Monilinia fructicola TaxID=38448 RepID=A0A5M9JDV9_MONFR|nr:hypothetical protein EYC84_009698 [Monilinia fructicola]